MNIRSGRDPCGSLHWCRARRARDRWPCIEFPGSSVNKYYHVADSSSQIENSWRILPDTDIFARRDIRALVGHINCKKCDVILDAIAGVTHDYSELPAKCMEVLAAWPTFVPNVGCFVVRCIVPTLAKIRHVDKRTFKYIQRGQTCCFYTAVELGWYDWIFSLRTIPG